MDIMQILVTLKPVIDIIITVLLGLIAKSLSKQLGITLQQTDIETIKSAILNLITNTENRFPTKTGGEKKQIVCDQVLASFNDPEDLLFSKKRKGLLEKIFGTVNFIAPLVETVFQASHLSKKH